MARNWLAVASAEHVRCGRQSGFMQVCHGKSALLNRIHPEDLIAYYSPTVTFGRQDKLHSFTAIGRVKQGIPYQVTMGDGFCPFRRDVLWFNVTETSIIPYLDELDFTKGKRNWGYQLRFGLLLLNDHDMHLIARAMNAMSTDSI